MKNISKTFLIFFVIMLVMAGLLSVFEGDQKQQPEEVSVSAVVERVKAGEVENIEVRGNSIKVLIKDGSELITYKEAIESVNELLLSYGVSEQELQGANIQIKTETGLSYWLGVVLPFLLPILLIVGFVWFLSRQVQGVNKRAMSFGQSSAKGEKPEDKKKHKVKFVDVAGAREAKDELEEIVQFLKHPKKFIDMGAKIPKGVLLIGPPGCGKTLLARAVAGEAGVPFFHVSGSEFVEMFVGVGASRVRSLFQKAKKNAPCIVFLDELDAVGRRRGAGLGGSHDEREQTLNQILVEMDGFEPNEGVIVLSASVTGDTPILVKDEKNRIKLLPVADFIDVYYKENEEGVEKPIKGVQALGFDKLEFKKFQSGLYFGKSAFKDVRGVFRHKVKEIYEINYIGGKVRTTGNHSVFVRGRRGLSPKPVSELRKGDILVDLPYKVNRTNKSRRDIRAHQFSDEFELELSIYQINEEMQEKYEFAMASQGILSQSQIATMVGYSQVGVSKWHRKLAYPRVNSRAYFKHTLPEKVKVTPSLMRLFGYYTAEGYARKEVDFCFSTKEKGLMRDLQSLIYENFGLEPDRIKERETNATNIIYHSKPLANFFIEHIGKGAHNKKIPSFLWGAPKEYLLEFLKGYALGDGHQDKKGRLEITSVSKQIILELNWLCRMHGIKTYLGSFTVKAGRVIGSGKPLAKVTAYKLGFGRGHNPFTPSEVDNCRRAIVTSVKKMSFNGYVYDLCGCGNEAFFGGSSPILLHNTNRPDVLDPALLRPGRFDRRVTIDLPDLKDRQGILEIHAKGKIFANDINLHTLAARTPGFSGADLANLLNEAAILAAKNNQQKIQMKDVLESIDKVMIGPARKSRMLSEKEKKITAYHEAGHAVVAHMSKHADPVHKISIISRGQAGGYTIKLPVEDKHMHSYSEFLDDLAVLLGGYAAEKFIFGELTTGATSDLRRATDLAKQLVTQYGMSKSLGPRTFGEKEEMIFLGREISEQKDYSERTQEKIDKEVSSFIEGAQKTALAILEKNKEKLEKVTKALLEKEVLERDEFEKLVGKKQ